MIRENLIEMGARIKEIRKALRISQKDMAAGLEMANCNLSEIESGKGNPGHAFFFKLSTRFNVSLDYLFHGKGEMFTTYRVKRDDGDELIIDHIETIDDLLWYLDNSTMFRNQVLGYAAQIRYENEEVIKKDISRKRSKKKES